MHASNPLSWLDMLSTSVAKGDALHPRGECHPTSKAEIRNLTEIHKTVNNERKIRKQYEMESDHGTGSTMVAMLGVLFVGSLLAGALPYRIQFQSSAQLHIASALGGGLLIGSALGIIIPEGFHALPHHCEHDHDTVHRTKDSHDELHDEHGEGIPAGLPGLALVVGFLLMMLLENLQSGDSHFHVHEHDSASGSDGILLRGKSDGDDMEVSRGNNSKGCISTSLSHSHGKHTLPSAAINGLLIHCAADGLAMGSAFLSSNATLTVMVAMAMIFHKAPMAFGLGSYLLGCQIPWATARRTIFVFSLTAPISTVVTYCLFSVVPLLATPASVALAVLFSGGTFLHAATMHILPDILGVHAQWNIKTMGAVVVGSLLPVVLSWNHHH